MAEHRPPVPRRDWPLTDPTAHGGTAADAFDVIIPSLPGFGFSDKPTEGGWNVERTARAWGVLVQRLGHRRYVAQGGDWGAFVTTAMAQQRAPGLAAIHLNFAQTIPDVIPAVLLPDQKRAVEAMKVFREKGSAYLQLQSTRPQLVYPQLFYWHELDRGGHFAQLEVPQLFSEELRLCFRSFHSA